MLADTVQTKINNLDEFRKTETEILGTCID